MLCCVNSVLPPIWNKQKEIIPVGASEANLSGGFYLTALLEEDDSVPACFHSLLAAANLWNHRSFDVAFDSKRHLDEGAHEPHKNQNSNALAREQERVECV